MHTRPMSFSVPASLMFPHWHYFHLTLINKRAHFFATEISETFNDRDINLEMKTWLWRLSTWSLKLTEINRQRR